MSKFAAIEARCTQYPANANDIVWLVNRVRELEAALKLEQHGVLPDPDRPSFYKCVCCGWESHT